MEPDQRKENDAQGSEWVLFINVDKETFTRDYLNAPDKTISRAWNAFDKSPKPLLVKITESLEHAEAARALDRVVLRALQPMGLDEKLRCGGIGRRLGEKGAKEPDSQYAPTRYPPNWPRNWPGVVLEVALSESASKVMSDVRYWVRQGDGAVQITLTLRIHRQNPRIIIEKWVQFSAGCPQRVQSIVVLRKHNGDFIVQGGPLVIEFDKLFLRQPKLPKEKDILLEDDQLISLAKQIWRNQGFYEDEDE